MLSFVDASLKRVLDLVLGLLALIIFLPIWLIVALIIKIDSPGPALYIHTRIGKNGKEFNCYKFRTMRADADPNRLAESKEDDRITNVGNFLRKTSLDETPQLINVILGDMSIVGPRPALEVQVKHFNNSDMWKLQVKPGLTGWTQVNGRNSIPYNKRLELDCWYVRHRNIFLDLWIILKTFKVLLLGDGIYDKNSSSPVTTFSDSLQNRSEQSL